MHIFNIQMYLLVSEDKAMKYLSPVGPEYHKTFQNLLAKLLKPAIYLIYSRQLFVFMGKERHHLPSKTKINAESYNWIKV